MRSAEDCTAAGPGGRALGSLGMLLVREIPGPGLIRKEHRHVVVREARGLQAIGDPDRLALTLSDCKYCLFHCDISLLLTLNYCRGFNLLRFNFQLIVDLVRAGDGLRLRADTFLFLFGLNRAAQRDDAIHADYFDVVSCHRKRIIFL